MFACFIRPPLSLTCVSVLERGRDRISSSMLSAASSTGRSHVSNGPICAPRVAVVSRVSGAGRTPSCSVGSVRTSPPAELRIGIRVHREVSGLLVPPTLLFRFGQPREETTGGLLLAASARRHRPRAMRRRRVRRSGRQGRGIGGPTSKSALLSILFSDDVEPISIAAFSSAYWVRARLA